MFGNFFNKNEVPKNTTESKNTVAKSAIVLGSLALFANTVSAGTPGGKIEDKKSPATTQEIAKKLSASASEIVAPFMDGKLTFKAPGKGYILTVENADGTITLYDYDGDGKVNAEETKNAAGVIVRQQNFEDNDSKVVNGETVPGRDDVAQGEADDLFSNGLSKIDAWKNKGVTPVTGDVASN